MKSMSKTGLMVVMLMAVLTACATLAPKTFNESVAVALNTVTTVRQTTTTLLNNKVISSRDAANVQTQANVAREGIEVARTLEGVDATDKLNTSIQVLTALEKYLAEKQKDAK